MESQPQMYMSPFFEEFERSEEGVTTPIITSVPNKLERNPGVAGYAPKG